MKNMIMSVILLTPILLMAQNKNEGNTVKTSGDTEFWMEIISSNSEMRTEMMNMMIVKTTGNKEEMLNLVDAILDNPEMREMIISENNLKTRNGDISIEPRGMTNETVKEKEMSGVKRVPKK